MSKFHSVVSIAVLAVATACAGAADEPGTGDAEVAGAGAELSARPVLRVPPPSGPFSVGVRSAYALDRSRIDPVTERPRAIPIRTFYPRASRGFRGTPARYLAPAVQSSLETALQLPERSFEVEVRVREDARPRFEFRGVILASGGWRTPVALETSLITELASHGFVVVAMDHPHDTLAVEQPSGELVQGSLDATQAFPERVLDVGVVLARLSELVPEAAAATPVAMFGHSLGGATAAESLRIYPRLRAAVILDGTPRGDVVRAGLDEPLGIMTSNTFGELGLVDVELETLIANQRGPLERVDLPTLHHYGFSDLVLFNPQAAAADPELGALLEAQLRTDSSSVEEGSAALLAQRRFLLRFMKRYVTARP